MKVAILGATGMTGRRIVTEVRAAGYEIRLIARDPSKATFDDTIEVLQGDATNPDSIRELIRGCDAVASAIGPTNQSKKIAKTMICSQVTGYVIEAMKAEDIARYVLVSSAALVLPTDKRNLAGLALRFLGPLILGDILRDKKIEYRLLKESNLDWILVRAPEIHDGDPSGRVDVLLETNTSFKVLSGDVAKVVVDQLSSREYLRKGIFVSANLDDLHDIVTRRHSDGK